MTVVGQLESDDNPAWLLEPPDNAEIAPPIDTHAQELPFGGLTWQNFERLCRSLASLDGDVEYCRLYGTAGQEQGGIDIYVRRTSTAKYATWQSKRHKSFGPAKIDAAVKEFLDGPWAGKSDRFVLCVQANLGSADVQDKIEECAAQLRERGVEFQPLDGEQLGLRLKSQATIVSDFFGLAWAERFCGKQAADGLAKRLTPSEFYSLKRKLRSCYISHFASVDPGVLSLLNSPTGGKRQFQLSERFIEPDLMLQAEVVADEVPSAPQQTMARTDPSLSERATLPLARKDDSPRKEKTRIAAENWIATANHDIVLGVAGAGKSTLLRFIALDMLSETPKFVALRSQHPDFLPVWVSFAFWTKLIAADKDRCSLIDAIESWFRRQDEPDLLALVRKAYDDKRLFLLVDGIDEWDNETAANTAFTLLQSLTERHSIRAIMTGRPHGFRLITGLDGSWRTSEIASFSVDQQVALAKAWFAHLNPGGESVEEVISKANRQATAFVEELQRNGPMAQLAATPLLLTGLIALKQAHLQLPRNRFLAYDELTKLLLDLHPTARDKAALAGSPRHTLDLPTREMTLAALAYAIHSGQEGASPDSIDIDQAINVVSQCLIQRIGMSASDANQNARAILTLGEEDIGILVKKSTREVGFFHRVFQEFLSSLHLASLEFEQQIELVGARAADPRWREVILCLLYKLQRPAEVDRLLGIIEGAAGDIATLASRDTLLAEATFGEFKKTPQLAIRLADKAFDQIELGRWPSVRRALVTQAIEGLSSPILGPKISDKLRQWFPRWTSYGLQETFEVIGRWPDDPGIETVLWRGLHDEYFGAAQAAARTLARCFGGHPEIAERLSRLIADPASISAAAAAIEAFWRGWLQHPSAETIFSAARDSESSLIAIAGIRGLIALGKQCDDDFTRLTEIGERDDYTLNGVFGEALLAGWAGREKLRQFALRETDGERHRYVRRLRPDFGLLINGFPGDPQVAKLVAADFKKEHPHCLFDREDLADLAKHFRGDPVVTPALESWVIKNRPDDAYTLSHAARVAPTRAIKAALLKCVEGNHLAFWAASALLDLWGAADTEVHETLNKVAEQPIDKRQDIAHALPLVMSDKERCRELLLEVVECKEDGVRADFALQGLLVLGIDASDREATDRVLTRGYDKDRFVVQNEVREVISGFYGDERVVGLAKRELERQSGAIATVAKVFAGDATMRKLVLDAAAPLDANMRSAIVESLSTRAISDPYSRARISAARGEESGDIVIEASISFAQANRDSGQLRQEYLDETVSELDAIGSRMDSRRQAAVAALIVMKRLDLLPQPDQFSEIHGIGMHKHREMLRLVAAEWAAVVEGLGGEDEALNVLGVQRGNFFEVFGNDIDSSKGMTKFALSLVEASSNGLPAPAIRFVERNRPNSGLLRDICLRGLSYSGQTNWDTFSTVLTAGEALGRNFSSDQDLEARLTRDLEADPRHAGTIMALCEGWPKSVALQALRTRLEGQPQLPIPVMLKLVSVISRPDRLVEVLEWAASELQGNLWESPAHWIPSTIRRLKQDDAACSLMLQTLLDQPSPGVKASFPRLLVRARGLTEELRAWCQSETVDGRNRWVGEVGMDLIAGQQRLVALSLFDILSGQDH
ncbi:NACHT domain-containing protein [Bradyrhizobium ganzhouense]|uniref:NACHT domain-containing protein n=1 Tax=Bradyrhizobium ganzhouense TaxID=1179767 RepID=UPI003CF608D1